MIDPLAQACADMADMPPLHDRQYDRGPEEACKVGCPGCAERVASADADRSGLSDDDFQFMRAWDNKTKPRTATAVFAHRPDGREVSVEIWPDEEPPQHVGSVTASAYIGDISSVSAWARGSALVEKQARRFR